MLLIYASVTANEKPVKQIDVLAILVELSEKILRFSITYQALIRSDYENSDADNLQTGSNFLLKIVR